MSRLRVYGLRPARCAGDVSAAQRADLARCGNEADRLSGSKAVEVDGVRCLTVDLPEMWICSMGGPLSKGIGIGIGIGCLKARVQAEESTNGLDQNPLLLILERTLLYTPRETSWFLGRFAEFTETMLLDALSLNQWPVMLLVPTPPSSRDAPPDRKLPCKTGKRLCISGMSRKTVEHHES